MRIDNRPADRHPRCRVFFVVHAGLKSLSAAPGSRPFPLSSTGTITRPACCISVPIDSTRPHFSRMESIVLLIRFSNSCWSWTDSRPSESNKTGREPGREKQPSKLPPGSRPSVETFQPVHGWGRPPPLFRAFSTHPASRRPRRSSGFCRKQTAPEFSARALTASSG